MHAINNIRMLAELCRNREPLPDAVASWLSSSLQSFLDQRSASLNDAFGVRNARGGIPWRVEASIRIRDGALRTLAAAHLSDLSKSAKAARLHQLSVRYEASRWRFDRGRQDMPATYYGTPQEFLWQAFKSGAMMPIGERQLRTILAA